jgi:hypothetical protein
MASCYDASFYSLGGTKAVLHVKATASPEEMHEPLCNSFGFLLTWSCTIVNHRTGECFRSNWKPPDFNSWAGDDEQRSSPGFPFALLDNIFTVTFAWDREPDLTLGRLLALDIEPFWEELVPLSADGPLLGGAFTTPYIRDVYCPVLSLACDELVQELHRAAREDRVPERVPPHVRTNALCIRRFSVLTEARLKEISVFTEMDTDYRGYGNPDISKCAQGLRLFMQANNLKARPVRKRLRGKQRHVRERPLSLRLLDYKRRQAKPFSQKPRIQVRAQP